MDSTQWYVAVEGRTVGPVTTELLRRGLEIGRVPIDALVCAIGDAEWQSITKVPPFSYELFGAPKPPTAPPPAPFGGGADPFARARALAPSLARGGNGAKPHSTPDDGDDGVTLRPDAPEPSGEPEASTSPTADPALDGHEPSVEPEDLVQVPAPSAVYEEEPAPPSDLDVDVVFDTFDDETRPRYYNWQKRIVEFFHDASEVTLPEESLLVGSLPFTPAAVLIQDDALWNLAICMAVGSDSLADRAAEAFFDTFSERPSDERLEWMTRTLLSRGFVPSGIPSAAGQRAVDVLRRNCPTELRAALEKSVWE